MHSRPYHSYAKLHGVGSDTGGPAMVHVSGVATMTILVVVALEIVVATQEYQDNTTARCCPLGYDVSSDGTNCLCDSTDNSLSY